MSQIKYKHTNIVAKDWRRLATFYETVLECSRLLPERHLSGSWLARGTGVAGAELAGVHLRLPGGGENGPTLEIFQYRRNADKPAVAANREGFSHIAFEVEEVPAVLAAILDHGGAALGEVTIHEIENVGRLTFVYAADPEGNIIELQSWG
jgi:predicted enzyme related to lactoylglutathione lyase